MNGEEKANVCKYMITYKHSVSFWVKSCFNIAFLS